MIKLTHSQGASLVAFLLTLREANQAGWNEWNALTPQDRYGAVPRRTPEGEQFMEDINWQAGELSQDLAQLMQGILEQLGGRAYEPDEQPGALIDLLAEELCGRHTRNILADETLQTLRDAVLTPSERAKLRIQLREQTWFCAGGCGRELHNEEIIIKSGRAGRDAAFSCMKCALPRYVPCSTGNCKGLVEVPDNLRRFLLKSHTCVACQGKDIPAEQPAPMDDPMDALRAVVAGNQARLGRVAGRIQANVMPARPVQFQPPVGIFDPPMPNHWQEGEDE